MAAPRPLRRRSRWPVKRRHAAAAAVVAAIVASGVFVAEPMRVPTGSMRPTLQPGDHVLVGKLAEPGRGDLAVFARSGELSVKRVVALGGDEIGIEDGELVVNGRTVEEPYVDHRLLDGVYFGPVTVPPGSVFVLGDNRTDSIDSRTFGPVARSDVLGRVVLRLWRQPRRR
ncbi:signal peptidase I [Micromonospora chersina]|uniref:signal peptidase I n=1 Tax=Micromonospora chersina TaxID=47854 RepID=UPI00371D46BD